LTIRGLKEGEKRLNESGFVKSGSDRCFKVILFHFRRNICRVERQVFTGNFSNIYQLNYQAVFYFFHAMVRQVLKKSREEFNIEC